MAKESLHQTHYTRQMHYLLAKIYKQSAIKDTLLDHAIEYFKDETFKASDAGEDEEVTILEQGGRDKRHAALVAIAFSILDLAEGENYNDNNRKSAQFLGSIQLLSITEGRRIAESNEQNKAPYKAVLCLRLLDRLIIDENIDDPYINKFLTDITPEQYIDLFNYDKQIYQRFVLQVKIPLIIAALLQDIGNYHPKAQSILVGNEKSLDPFRTLDNEQRKELMKINYSETIKYVDDGLGMPSFIGNTKAERNQFVGDEQGKLMFIKKLLKSSIDPKDGIGNILKVPQIYTSIILSTKSNYNYKLLPQVFQVLNKNSEIGACSQTFVDALYKITGMFPQGFGIVLMPNSDFLESGDCYEYAIVNGLYPSKPQQPICRMATRKLTFIGYGQNCEVIKNNNLYFTNTAKKLAAVSIERLHEILELLSSNFKERKELDLLPRCWHANDFFSIKANQNLWNIVDKTDDN